MAQAAGNETQGQRFQKAKALFSGRPVQGVTIAKDNDHESLMSIRQKMKDASLAKREQFDRKVVDAYNFLSSQLEAKNGAYTIFEADCEQFLSENQDFMHFELSGLDFKTYYQTLYHETVDELVNGRPSQELQRLRAEGKPSAIAHNQRFDDFHTAMANHFQQLESTLSEEAVTLSNTGSVLASRLKGCLDFGINQMHRHLKKQIQDFRQRPQPQQAPVIQASQLTPATPAASPKTRTAEPPPQPSFSAIPTQPTPPTPAAPPKTRTAEPPPQPSLSVIPTKPTPPTAAAKLPEKPHPDKPIKPTFNPQLLPTPAMTKPHAPKPPQPPQDIPNGFWTLFRFQGGSGQGMPLAVIQTTRDILNPQNGKIPHIEGTEDTVETLFSSPITYDVFLSLFKPNKSNRAIQLIVKHPIFKQAKTPQQKNAAIAKQIQQQWTQLFKKGSALAIRDLFSDLKQILYSDHDVVSLREKHQPKKNAELTKALLNFDQWLGTVTTYEQHIDGYNHDLKKYNHDMHQFERAILNHEQAKIADAARQVNEFKDKLAIYKTELNKYRQEVDANKENRAN